MKDISFGIPIYLYNFVSKILSNMKNIRVHVLRVVVLLLAVAGLAGCKKSPDKILSENGQGVVMIVNQYYYKITLPTGGEWYFTGFDNDGDMENFTFDENEIKQNKAMLTGTGFIISDDGKILTNRHVATPSIDFTDAKHSVENVFNSFKQMIQEQMRQMSSRYDELESQKADCYTFDEWSGDPIVDEDKLSEITSEQQQLSNSYQSAAETWNKIDNIDVSDIKIEPVYDVSVAYNNTFVTKLSDLSPCVVTAVSKDADVDLAMLQLKNKKTPDNAAVLELADDDTDIKVDDKLYMIGFNAGFSLSNTSQGIKAQITSGNISQTSDNNKIMYTIPALPGSSGSPVFNEYGKIVAVNFAGVSTTQSFNYGIKLKKVRRFIEDN